MVRLFILVVTLLSLVGCATQPTLKNGQHFSTVGQAKEDHSWHQGARGSLR